MRDDLEGFEAASQGDAVPEIVEPRHAASLILVDKTGDTPRFLMGRRSKGHGFMPGVFVFPGGAVEAGDLEIADRFALSPHAQARLEARTNLDRAMLPALPLAAVRETFEETGLIVGSSSPFENPPQNWSGFAAVGTCPRCDALVPVARAITPPDFPIRFDARFFAANAANLVPSSHNDRHDVSDELEDLGWYDVRELAEMRLAEITRRILRDIESRLLAATLFDPRQEMPFYHVENGVSHRDLL
ncbi:NUDIX hydrolase [Fulvimarina sp. MAC3]|uniref:NUDIX hydrolase n=1 Tax=Fulvimarina sp. MAC3 TaxID=3148887 RepID=UPI0031FD7538